MKAIQMGTVEPDGTQPASVSASNGPGRRVGDIPHSAQEIQGPVEHACPRCSGCAHTTIDVRSDPHRPTSHNVPREQFLDDYDGKHKHAAATGHVTKLFNFDSEVNLLLVVSGLIITLSFAAVLQPPGGISSDGSPTDQGYDRKVGEANLLVGDSSNSFWVFFIANGTAMAAASFAILLLLACPPSHKSMVLGKIFVGFAIPCSLAAFCAAVWIIGGRATAKVLPFFLGALMLCVCVPVYFLALYCLPKPKRNE